MYRLNDNTFRISKFKKNSEKLDITLGTEDGVIYNMTMFILEETIDVYLYIGNPVDDKAKVNEVLRFAKKDLSYIIEMLNENNKILVRELFNTLIIMTKS